MDYLVGPNIKKVSIEFGRVPGVAGWWLRPCIDVMTISSETRMYDYKILSLNLSESVQFNYIGICELN